MATIEKYCAPGVYDTPSYSQAIKVTGAQTILFLAGQVPYAPDGTVNHIGNFMGQARQVFGAVKDGLPPRPRRVLRPARAGFDDGRGQLAVAPRLPD